MVLKRNTQVGKNNFKLIYLVFLFYFCLVFNSNSKSNLEGVFTDIKILDKISSKKVLISVGGIPKKLNIPGVDLAWTSDDIFELEKFPKSILIVGGGYIACEFASIFRNLGIEASKGKYIIIILYRFFRMF